MDLGILEGQTRGDYFLNSIFDPSVNQCTHHPLIWPTVESLPTTLAEALKHKNQLSPEPNNSKIIKPPYVEPLKTPEFVIFFHFFTSLETFYNTQSPLITLYLHECFYQG